MQDARQSAMQCRKGFPIDASESRCMYLTLEAPDFREAISHKVTLQREIKSMKCRC